MTSEPIYIEAEEEVPEIIERVRGVGAEDIRLVLPAGARLAKSRFGFQLLNQYASRLGKTVSIVSGDPAVAQMARENGFASFATLDHQYPMADPGYGPLSVARAEPAPPGAPSPVAGGGRTRPMARPLARPAPLARGPLPRSPLAVPGLSGLTRSPWLRALAAWRPDRTTLYIGAGALLLVGIVAMVVLAPSASVTLVVQAQPYANDVEVDAQPGGGAIAVHTQTSQKTITASIQATGVKSSAGQAAKGQVVFTNNCPLSKGLQLSAGQEVATDNGIVFVDEGDTGPIARGDSATVNVHADKPGQAGNVGANQITTIANAGFYSACLQVTNPQPMSGGEDGQTGTVVSAADIQQARNLLDQQARQQITQELQQKAPAGEKLSATITYQSPSFSTDHKADDGVKTFNATLTEQGEGTYYSNDDLTKAFTEALSKKIPPGQQLLKDSVQIDTPQVTTTAGGHLTFKGKASGYIAPAINQEALRKKLPGMSVGSALALLHQQPVRDVLIRQYPFPLPMMPFIGSRIDLTYKIQTAS